MTVPNGTVIRIGGWGGPQRLPNDSIIADVYVYVYACINICKCIFIYMYININVSGLGGWGGPQRLS